MHIIHHSAHVSLTWHVSVHFFKVIACVAYESAVVVMVISEVSGLFSEAISVLFVCKPVKMPSYTLIFKLN